jgi:hypothetical protein
MSQDLQDPQARVDVLEKRLRRWKMAAGLAGAVLVLLLLAGLGSAVAANRAARHQEEVARYHAEQARKQMERAKKQAEDADAAVRRLKRP